MAARRSSALRLPWVKPAGTLLAIDSGSPSCAYATVMTDTITSVGALTVDADLSALDYVRSGKIVRVYDHVIVEVPTIRGDATPNPEDLLLIAILGSRLAERFAKDGRNVREVRPSQWKGNVPKPAHHMRQLWPHLTDAERNLLGGSRTHKAILAAAMRGAKDRWQKQGARYYRASELPTVNGLKITHDLLDAAALALYALGRI